MSQPIAISLVLPCRDQADHIGRIIHQYRDVMAALAIEFELVVVPNSCTDGTVEAVTAIAAGDPRVVCVASPLGGWGRSVRLGLASARGAILAYTNSARTDPALIPQFLDAYRDGGDCLVKARRVARGAALRSVGSTLYNLEARFCFGLTTGDVNGTPKVFGRAFYEAAHLASDGDLLDLELMVRARRWNLPVREIPVHGFRRHGGRSSTGLSSALGMYTGAVRLWLSGAA